MAEKRTISFDDDTFKKLELLRKYFCFSRSECVRLFVRRFYEDVSNECDFIEFKKRIEK